MAWDLPYLLCATGAATQNEQVFISVFHLTAVSVISNTSVFKAIWESHKVQKLWRLETWEKPHSKSSKVKLWPSSDRGWEAELWEQAKGSWGLQKYKWTGKQVESSGNMRWGEATFSHNRKKTKGRRRNREKIRKPMNSSLNFQGAFETTDPPNLQRFPPPLKNTVQ